MTYLKDKMVLDAVKNSNLNAGDNPELRELIRPIENSMMPLSEKIKALAVVLREYYISKDPNACIFSQELLIESAKNFLVSE